VTEQAERPRPDDSLRLATPRIDDVEARRARASVASKLFGGPREPVRVGRYQVQGRIGTGGMGVVYRAHDPELARDVAVKLMNAEAVGDDQTATARARLVREARAMARLAHPNVIHVYDVGAVEDGVFIAMELVEGGSLATWLREAPGGVPRDWRDVLRVYVDAGRGLAAAHAAGIVHRDFKPENVLVGSDGRVRVGDFGLAGTPTIDDADPESGEDMRLAEVDEVGIAGTLTRTGALLGTPRYMAPEQEHGALASARSDQFSFCVALYEGLYGRAPYDGDNVARYRRNVRAGRIVGAPLDTKVRGWVYAEIVRGMAVDPASRHPGMDALLDRLERALVDPRLVSRSWVRRIAMSVPVIGVALGIGAWVGAQRGDGAANESTQVVASETGVLETEPPDEEVTPRADAPTIAAPTIPLGAALPAKPLAKAPGLAPKPTEKPGPSKKRMHCYFQEDVGRRITQEPKRVAFVSDEQNCYANCRNVTNKPIADTLTPDDDCAHKYVCAEEPATSCTASSSG